MKCLFLGIRMAPVLAVMFVLFLYGCGMIADKDRIVIARVDNEPITRGDFFRILREMEDDERPHLRSKADVLRVLNKHIDDLITLPLGRQMAAEGKINIPREIAREQYFHSKGEAGNEMRFMFSLDLDDMAAMTELMQVYNLTPELIRSRRDIIELYTDRIVEQMQAEAAVGYLAMENFQSGQLEIDETALAREYELRKDEFKEFEWVSFRAFRFPAAMPNALEEAAALRNRIDAGEHWDDLEEEYLARDPDFVAESEIENNPDLAKFSNFWSSVSGARAGEIHGPIFFPEYQIGGTDAQGRPQPVDVPPAYLVIRILESEPERILTLEEARDYVIPQILISQQMRKLREEHHVIIYDDALFDPGRFSSDDSLGF